MITYRLVWFFGPWVFADGLTSVGGRLPKIISACANPVSKGIILGKQSGHSVVGYDATLRLSEDSLHHRMPQEAAGERLTQATCGGYFCKSGRAANREGLRQAESDDGLLTDKFIML